MRFVLVSVGAFSLTLLAAYVFLGIPGLTLLLFAGLGVVVFATYVVSEVLVFRAGGDVYAWAKELANILPD
jgi:hypothetical protein